MKIAGSNPAGGTSTFRAPQGRPLHFPVNFTPSNSTSGTSPARMGSDLPDRMHRGHHLASSWIGNSPAAANLEQAQAACLGCRPAHARACAGSGDDTRTTSAHLYHWLSWPADRRMGRGGVFDSNRCSSNNRRCSGQTDAIIRAKDAADRDALILFPDMLFEADFSVIRTTDADVITFVKEVPDPSALGIAVEQEGGVVKLVEKPQNPVSKMAVWRSTISAKPLISIAPSSNSSSARSRSRTNTSWRMPCN